MKNKLLHVLVGLLVYLSLFQIYGYGQNTLAGNLTVQYSTRYTGAITPTQITSNQNDYAPTGFATAASVYLSTDAARTVTGLAGGAAGREVRLFYSGTGGLTLVAESGSSTAANRFAFQRSYVMSSGSSLLLNYDGAASRWRIVGDQGGEVVNLRKWGAKGDGTTNDTVAINIAVAFATATGVPIYAPKGTYITDGITISGTGIHFYGDGPTKTIFKASASCVNVVTLSGYEERQLLIHDFSIDGTAGSGSGIYRADTSGFLYNSTIYNLDIRNNAQYGIFVITNFSNIWRNIYAQDNGKDQFFFEGQDTELYERLDFGSTSTGYAGIRVMSGGKLVACNGVYQTNNGTNYIFGGDGTAKSNNVQRWPDITMENCGVEAYQTIGVEVLRLPHFMRITGCKFWANYANVIAIKFWEGGNNPIYVDNCDFAAVGPGTWLNGYAFHGESASSQITGVRITDGSFATSAALRSIYYATGAVATPLAMDYSGGVDSRSFYNNTFVRTFQGSNNFNSIVSMVMGNPTYNANTASAWIPLTGMPSTGTWQAGDFVPFVGSYSGDRGGDIKTTLLGWRRITTGSGNVLGTDWVPMHTLEQTMQNLATTSAPQFAKIGVGVAPDATAKIYTNGQIKTTDTTAGTDTASGSGVFGGDLGVAGTGRFGGSVNVVNSLSATSANGTQAYVALTQTGRRQWRWRIPAGGSTLVLTDVDGGVDPLTVTYGTGEFTFSSVTDSTAGNVGSINTAGGIGAVKRITAGGLIMTTGNSLRTAIATDTEHGLQVYRTDITRQWNFVQQNAAGGYSMLLYSYDGSTFTNLINYAFGGGIMVGSASAPVANQFGIAYTQEATTGGGGAINTAGGVYAAKKIIGNSDLVIAGTVIHTLSATPASASATGTVGTLSWDADYIYICTATNTWKRVAIATW